MARLVTDYIDPAAAAFPDKTAFVDERRGLSFAALRQEAHCVATALAKRGIRREPVAVFLPRCVECVACFLGTALSGNFYSLIDVRMPRERIQQMVDILRPRVILTDAAHAAEARERCDSEVLVYEEIQGIVSWEAILPATSEILDTDPLCVLFTSGSTGQPKGVVLSHRSFVTNVEVFSESFSLDKSTVMAISSPLFHVRPLRNIFATVRNICTTCFMPYEKVVFPMEFITYLIENNINVLVCVPSNMNMIASCGLFEEITTFPCLQKIFFGGEYIHYSTIQYWKKHFSHCLFIHGYGSTETAGGCSGYILDREYDVKTTIPIGTVRNSVLFVLNSEDKPVQPGEIGEICARGPQLALGYYRNPEQTSKCFVQNPLHDDYPEIIYRTGDLGYYSEEGELFLAGRKDAQIKHMGYRIEPGEIEAAALAVDGVNLACCLYHAEKTMLVLFYTGEAERLDLVRGLKRRLPSYMVPHRVERLDRMPFGQSGKLDRRALCLYL